MEAAKQSAIANDYAVARELNLRVMGLIMLVYFSHDTSISNSLDIQEINRVYILLVDELQKLYDRDPKLSAIEPEPIWKHFEVVKFYTKEIKEYVSDNNDHGGTHFAKVEKLCILSNANTETPRYTPEQQELIDYANEIMADFEIAHEARKNNKANNWHIPGYSLTYKYGSILINDVLKLKKAHDGSALDELMLQALNNLNKMFTFTPKKDTKRTVSTILSNAGFTPTLRKLFFPEVGKSRGVLFRPSVSSETAKAERIDTAELDLQLKELGATTK